MNPGKSEDIAYLYEKVKQKMQRLPKRKRLIGLEVSGGTARQGGIRPLDRPGYWLRPPPAHRWGRLLSGPRSKWTVLFYLSPNVVAPQRAALAVRWRRLLAAKRLQRMLQLSPKRTQRLDN